MSGSRTRAERLAKDLQDQGLNAFYGQDGERILNPGEIMVVYGHARKGFEYPLVKFAVTTETDILARSRSRAKKRKPITGRESKIFPSCPSEILLSMKSMDLEFIKELKRLK